MGDVRLLILDLDGTLQDSYAAIEKELNQTLAAFGMPVMDEPTSVAIAPLTMRDSFVYIVGHDGELADRLTAHYFELFRARPVSATPLFPGVRDTLLQCHRIGLPVALATNKQAEYAERDLVRHELRQCFGLIMGGDSAARPKPYPDMIYAILERTSVDPAHALFVGDTVTDIRIGLAAGIVTCGAGYGYDGAALLREAGAHHIIDSFPELLPLVQ